MTRVINHSVVVIQGNCTGEKRLPSHAVVIRDATRPSAGILSGGLIAMGILGNTFHQAFQTLEPGVAVESVVWRMECSADQRTQLQCGQLLYYLNDGRITGKVVLKSWQVDIHDHHKDISPKNARVVASG